MGSNTTSYQSELPIGIHNTMPDMFGNIRPDICTQVKTPVHNYLSRTSYRCSFVSAMPHKARTRPKGIDVRDGNETKRIATRMFLTMLDHDLGTELRDWYEDGFHFYSDLIENGENNDTSNTEI